MIRLHLNLKLTHYFTAIFLVLLIFSCKEPNASNLNFDDFAYNLEPNEEPPLIFILNSESDTFYVVENQKSKLNFLKKDGEITIGIYDWRRFPHNNMTFEYPKHFSFEADLSPSLDIWTLSGIDFNIIVIHPSTEMSTKTYVQEMMNQFGPSNCSTKFISKKLNHKKLSGIELSVNLANVNIRLEVLEIRRPSGKKSFIVFQDTLDDNMESSQECLNVMRRLDQTFKIRE